MKTKGKIKNISSFNNFLFIRSESDVYRVNIDDLLYIKSSGNTLIVQTVNHKFITYATMMYVDNLLSKKGFYRVSRSYIVPISKIDSILGNDINIGQIKIPLGGLYKQAFLEFLSKIVS